MRATSDYPREGGFMVRMYIELDKLKQDGVSTEKI